MINVSYKNKKKKQETETAWVLIKNNAEEFWKKTSDVKEIANSLDLVFAENQDEAISQIRSRYPEETGPITYLKYTKYHRYESGTVECIKLNTNARLLENIDLTELTKFLKKYNGKIEISNIREVVGDTYYDSAGTIIDLRSKLYDAGIATNLRDNTLEYNPKKAKSIKKRMLNYYKVGKMKGINRLTFSEINNLSHHLKNTLRSAISDEIGISSYGWHIRPDWGTQVASYNVGGIIRSYALLYDRVFGKGSYRNHPKWQEIKERWKTLTPYKKKRLGTNFTDWMEEEFKKPRTRADLDIPKL